MTLYSPLQQINHPLFSKHQLNVWIKRDDLLHPIISGNKYRKLKYNINYAKALGKTAVLSFGGAYSNHIHALAYACFQQKLASTGIIRGEKNYANNFTLTWARYWGMSLTFVDRKTYKKRSQNDYLAQLQQQHHNSFIIPEGGSNTLALKGMGEVIKELATQLNYNTLICPVGSGGTFAGLIQADQGEHNLLGIGVLKQSTNNVHYFNNLVKNLLTEQVQTNWQILSNFHRGGYAKFSEQDSQRIREFIHYTAIPFEPIYSGKMLLAFLDLVTQGYFPTNETIVLLHTGGLQGLGGLAEQQHIQANEWPTPHLPLAP